MTWKKTKEIIGSYLEKVKVSPETDPKIQEMTREFQKKGHIVFFYLDWDKFFLL
jgi:hypothetical protein